MRARKRRLPYPPGPKGLPVVGNLFGMPPKGSQEWITYRKWSEELGSDILHINQLGSHLIILNSAKAANDLLDKHSSVYSDRPPLVVMQDLFKLDFNFGAAPYGPVWRHSRREFQANLGPATLDAYRPLEQQAAHRLLRNLLSSPENFMQHIRHMAGQVIFSIAYGIDVLPENDPYVADAERVMRAAALATTMEARLLDLIPWCIYYNLFILEARKLITSHSDQDAKLASRSPLQALCARMAPHCCKGYSLPIRKSQE
ncbi:cytochrome P450 [Lactarius quietus]|nr:cytochrome P450 [Lactarius quietus]